MVRNAKLLACAGKLGAERGEIIVVEHPSCCNVVGRRNGLTGIAVLDYVVLSATGRLRRAGACGRRPTQVRKCAVGVLFYFEGGQFCEELASLTCQSMS